MTKIGIIGLGYVGGAIAWAHQHQDMVIRDPKLKNSATLSQFTDCDAIFVCVPSPSTEDGHCDSSILEKTLEELLFVMINKPIPIICKTTAPPSVYARLEEQYPNIVHCPEFLTAENSITDYDETEFFILGGKLEWCKKAAAIIQEGVSINNDRFLFTNAKTAALHKYMMNSYLAMKVTFMNDFKALADAEGIQWNTMKELAGFDSRIGNTHMDVPGPDKQYGWGGHCFPKDVSAIIEEAIDLKVDFELMDRVEAINKKHRKL